MQKFFNSTVGRTVLSLLVVVLPTFIVYLQNQSSDNVYVALGLALLVTTAQFIKDLLNKNISNLPKDVK